MFNSIDKYQRNPLFDIFSDIFPDMITTQPVAKPKSNFWKDEKGYNIEIAAPGMNKSDIKVYFMDNNLVAEGAKKKKEEEKQGKTIYRNSFVSESFKETFLIGKDADKDTVKAVMEDGVLSITINKTKEEKPKQRLIEIE